MTEGTGDPVYRHPSLLPNKTLYYLLMFVLIMGFLLYMFFEYEIVDRDVGYDVGKWLNDGVSLIFFSMGLLLVVITVAVPYLFFPRRMTLTSEGMYTHFSRWKTTFRGKPRFIPYSRMDRVFPEFLPTFNKPDGTPEQDRLDCMIVHDVEGSDHKIPWTSYDTVYDNKAFYHMLVFLSRAPERFIDKWSDLPVMTHKEKELMKLMKEKGDKYLLTRKDRFYLIGLIATSGIMLLGMAALFILMTTEDDISKFGIIGLLVISFILMMPFASGLGNSKREKERIKGKMDLIEWVGDGNSFLELCRKENLKDIKGPVLVWEKKPTPAKKEPEDMEKMIRTIDGYRPVAQVLLMVLGFLLIIGGAMVLAFGGLNLITIPIGVIVMIGGIGLIVLLFFIWKDKDINDARNGIDEILATEARTGKRILPDEYRTPKWFFMRRGSAPASKEELRRIEAWTRISGKWMIRLTMMAIIGGMGLFIAVSIFFAFFLLYEDAVYVMVPMASVPMAGFGLGMYITIRRSIMVARLARLVKWEEKSGIRILSDTLRSNHQREEDFRNSY